MSGESECDWVTDVSRKTTTGRTERVFSFSSIP